MRYHYKRPGDWLWKSLDTPSIAKSAAGHRLGPDWRYRIEGDSTDRTLAELIEMDRITHDRADSTPTDPSLLGPDATNPTTGERVIFVLAAVVLVIKFFSALMPVSESPSPALNALNIAMELLAVIALIGLGV